MTGARTRLDDVLRENEELRSRLAEAQETLDAIRSGIVDALVVETPDGNRVFTLQSADHPYRLFVEEMQQGAVTLSVTGTILFCNKRFTEIVGVRRSVAPGDAVPGARGVGKPPGLRRTPGAVRERAGHRRDHARHLGRGGHPRVPGRQGVPGRRLARFLCGGLRPRRAQAPREDRRGRDPTSCRPEGEGAASQGGPPPGQEQPPGHREHARPPGKRRRG